MRVSTALGGVTRLGVDTPAIIYLVERNPKYVEQVKSIFGRLDQGFLTGFTSTLTITEVLAHPIKQGQVNLERLYHDILLNSLNFQVIAVDFDIAERAARLRAKYNLRTPDAIQIAVSLAYECEAFLTNDLALKRVTDLRVLILDELELDA